ncbi:MAG TPA: HD domain-containing phosphohydrolase [bacterium]|nr:MAG: Cyclic di-GMP phosphodiesterase response regulator RpfG [bacterium ADurb.Bin236]HOY62525.1 HD domain-containing phosphohydrolase [bacterium]HPI75192.1 HD domain-containing phosphohydrolase [bacterium]HPN95103.1 HD domain-containing phosphohydrolase [bacterium]
MGMKKIRIFDAEPGMILAKPVVVLHSGGRELMRPGFMLEKPHIKRLGKWGIEHIFVETYDGGADNNEVFSESIKVLAKQTYEDAITSLARLSKNLISEGACEIDLISRTITQILDVIALEQGVLSLLSKLKASDEYIYQHNVDVCVTALILGRSLELPEAEQNDLGTACLLHDLGLVAYKKQKWDNSMLTAAPANIRKHPLRSMEMAREIRGISENALAAVAQHHEYMDGSGYPEGLKAGQISKLASIIAVSEAFNTLVSPFDPANRVDPHQAMVTIVDPKYHRFDPEVLRVFVSNLAIYPAGTFVQLNNSMRAVVINSNRDNPLRPRILVIYEDETKPVKPFHVDLSDDSYRDWFIEGVISSANIMKSIEHIMKL